MIENRFVCFETHAYITQGIAACNLTEQQVLQLVVAGQVLCVSVSTILIYEFVELITRDIIHNLGENITTDVHNPAV